MISLLLGVVASCLVVSAAVTRRSVSNRLRPFEERGKVESQGFNLPQKLGELLSRVPPLKSYAKTASRRTALLATVLICPALFLRFPKVALILAAVLLVRPILVERSVRKRREREILRELPMTTDLMQLAVGSGLNITTSIQHVARFTSGPIASELSRVNSDVRHGRRLSEALERASDRLGNDVRPLFNALISSERYGSPLTESLDRLAFEMRRDEERRAEQAGQTLAVQLMLPLAATALPAFVALALPPALAAAYGSLALNF